MTARQRIVLAAAAAGYVAGVGLVVVGLSPTGPPEPDPAYAAAPVVAAGGSDDQTAVGDDEVQPTPGHSVRPGPALVGLPRSAPLSLEAPTIGVRANLRPVGLLPDGSIEVPPPAPSSVAGWYRLGASPGEAGPAVLVGHVDSARDGPAVFFRLGALRPGDPISVRRADGIVVRFRVTSVREYPKDRFPSAAVYGPTATPQLRLVTCGGPFDASARSYEDNVVAFAEMVATP
jgi:Sortase domain